MHHAEAESNALTDPLQACRTHAIWRCDSMKKLRERVAIAAPFQVVMLDLDDFKIVNDTFGHKVGDKMLREMARIIQAQLREYDFLARYAGDEFVAMVRNWLKTRSKTYASVSKQRLGSFPSCARAARHASVSASARQHMALKAKHWTNYWLRRTRRCIAPSRP